MGSRVAAICPIGRIIALEFYYIYYPHIAETDEIFTYWNVSRLEGVGRRVRGINLAKLDLVIEG